MSGSFYSFSPSIFGLLLCESVDAETIGTEGQPYTVKASIALWPAYGCVGSFGEVSLPDLSPRFSLALLLSLYF